MVSMATAVLLSHKTETNMEKNPEHKITLTLAFQTLNHYPCCCLGWKLPYCPVSLANNIHRTCNWSMALHICPKEIQLVFESRCLPVPSHRTMALPLFPTEESPMPPTQSAGHRWWARAVHVQWVPDCQQPWCQSAWVPWQRYAGWCQGPSCPLVACPWRWWGPAHHQWERMTAATNLLCSQTGFPKILSAKTLVCMCVCVCACAYVCLLWVILQSCMAVTTHLVKVGSRFTISSYKVRVLEKISNRWKDNFSFTSSTALQNSHVTFLFELHCHLSIFYSMFCL